MSAPGESEAEIRRLGRLAQEQAALRRIATMVARERPAEEVFAGVAEEVRRLVQAEAAAMWRYGSDGHGIVVGSWGTMAKQLPVGTCDTLDGDSVAAFVYRTRRPARFDDYETAASSIAAAAREVGVRSAVGSPIVVDGALWGSVVVGTSRPTPMPADAEARIAQFTDLVAAAISNIQVREDLAASRARVIATGDEQRRRVVRDLHDGAQQRLVNTIVMLKLARRELERYGPQAAALVDEPLEHALQANVAEALTNVAKHAHARSATVCARLDGGTLQLEVRDDGVGGANPDGTGLVGLNDRLAAHRGTLRVASPPDGGTVIEASIPVA